MRTTSFVVLAFTAMSIAQAQTTTAPNIPIAPQYATFGMIGLAADQTARVNALGLPMGGPIIAGALCVVTIQFFDETGKSLGSSTQPVVGGQAVHFDLKRTDIDTTEDRREIRATVRTAFPPSPAVATPVGFGLCSVKPTLEIFNSDGRTTAVLGETTALPLILPLAQGN
jgi:hypothetical protein